MQPWAGGPVGPGAGVHQSLMILVYPAFWHVFALVRSIRLLPIGRLLPVHVPVVRYAVLDTRRPQLLSDVPVPPCPVLLSGRPPSAPPLVCRLVVKARLPFIYSAFPPLQTGMLTNSSFCEPSDLPVFPSKPTQTGPRVCVWSVCFRGAVGRGREPFAH